MSLALSSSEEWTKGGAEFLEGEVLLRAITSTSAERVYFSFFAFFFTAVRFLAMVGERDRFFPTETGERSSADSSSFSSCSRLICLIVEEGGGSGGPLEGLPWEGGVRINSISVSEMSISGKRFFLAEGEVADSDSSAGGLFCKVGNLFYSGMMDRS